MLQEHALKELHSIIDHHWAEVSNKVTLIESLSEETTFAVSSIDNMVILIVV